MSHRILYQPSGPQVVASWLSSTLSRTSSENCASLLLMTPDARYAGWIQEALSRSASTALVGGMVCAIGHRQGIQRPGMSLSTFSNDKNTRCVPFYVPPDLLRSATKAVGRWPEQRRSTAMGDLWPSGFDLSNGSFSTTEETDATHAALQLQISITEQVGFPSPKLLLLLAGAQEAPAALRLLDTCFPWANKVFNRTAFRLTHSQSTRWVS